MYLTADVSVQTTFLLALGHRIRNHHACYKSHPFYVTTLEPNIEGKFTSHAKGSKHANASDLADYTHNALGQDDHDPPYNLQPWDCIQMDCGSKTSTSNCIINCACECDASDGDVACGGSGSCPSIMACYDNCVCDID